MSELFNNKKFPRKTENDVLRGSNPDPNDTNPAPRMGDLVKHRIIAALIEAINIVGGTIKTSTSGKRIEINGDSNTLKVYDENNNLVGQLLGELGEISLSAELDRSVSLSVLDRDGEIGGNIFDGAIFSQEQKDLGAMDFGRFWVDLIPHIDNYLDFGSTVRRWKDIRGVNIYGTNIYCANQTAENFVTGDLLFKDLYRVDENAEYLNFYNNKTNELIMKLGHDGTVYAKDFKKL